MYVLLETNHKNQPQVDSQHNLQFILMERLIVPPPGRNRSVLLPAILALKIPTPIALLYRVLLPHVSLTGPCRGKSVHILDIETAERPVCHKF